MGWGGVGDFWIYFFFFGFDWDGFWDSVFFFILDFEGVIDICNFDLVEDGFIVMVSGGGEILLDIWEGVLLGVYLFFVGYFYFCMVFRDSEVLGFIFMELEVE